MRYGQYFPHDATAASANKLMAMLEVEGARGYGVYWHLLEYLRMQHGYIGQLKVLSPLAQRMKTTQSILRRIITEYGLFSCDGERFYSPGLIRRMRPLDRKRREEVTGDPPPDPPQSGSPPLTPDLARDQTCNHQTGSDLQKTNPTHLINKNKEEKEEKDKEEKEEKKSPLTPPTGEETKDGIHFIVHPYGKGTLRIPRYAYERHTHNLDGLLLTLKQHGVSDLREVEAILRLSDYGRLGGHVWKIIYHTIWEKIKQPGGYLIAKMKAAT